MMENIGIVIKNYCRVNKNPKKYIYMQNCTRATSFDIQKNVLKSKNKFWLFFEGRKYGLTDKVSYRGACYAP